MGSVTSLNLNMSFWEPLGYRYWPICVSPALIIHRVAGEGIIKKIKEQSLS